MLRNLWGGALWVVTVTRRCDGHEWGDRDANILQRTIVPHKKNHSITMLVAAYWQDGFWPLQLGHPTCL